MKDGIDENYIRFLVSKNLRRIRTTRNFSQLSLSAKSGLTHNFINDIENCKKGISVRSLAKLSAALDVEPHQFFLSDGMVSNAQIYFNDVSDSLQKVVKDLAAQYLASEKK
jgi:transcriptional regulator with XRE-family HTH domain